MFRISYLLFILCATGNHAGIIGDFRWAFLNDVGWEAGPYADTIPHLVFAAFQMMFAMITSALITGAVVGRMRFKALFAFIALWSFLVYYPMAHMVWGEGGFLAAIGSVDFAGGNVVHISSGVSALVLATYLGRKKGYEKTSYRIHNIPCCAWSFPQKNRYFSRKKVPECRKILELSFVLKLKCYFCLCQCHRHLLSYALGTQQFSVSICCPCGSLTHIVNTCHLFHKP